MSNNARSIIRHAAASPASALRYALGAGIVLAGASLLIGRAAAPLAESLLALATSPGLHASILAGAATGLGAAVLLLVRRIDERRLGLFMGISAGMMFAAAVFSLLLPAMRLTPSPWSGAVVIAAIAGWLLMWRLDIWLPHLHATAPMGDEPRRRVLALMVVSIAVHNLPEGFAVGAGFGGGDQFGRTTALSIAAQNVPEGLIVALALWSLGMTRLRAALWALASGMIEPVGAVLGVAAVGAAPQVLPIAMAIAGGAMTFVVVDELIPDAFRTGSRRGVPIAFTIGFFAIALGVQAA